jgi:hypothetical protein
LIRDVSRDHSPIESQLSTFEPTNGSIVGAVFVCFQFWSECVVVDHRIWRALAWLVVGRDFVGLVDRRCELLNNTPKKFRNPHRQPRCGFFFALAETHDTPRARSKEPERP